MREGPLPAPAAELLETVDEPILALEAPASLAAELPAHLAAELVELLADAERYAAAAQAQNTTRAYASDWAQFEVLVCAL